MEFLGEIIVAILSGFLQLIAAFWNDNLRPPGDGEEKHQSE